MILYGLLDFFLFFFSLFPFRNTYFIWQLRSLKKHVWAFIPLRSKSCFSIIFFSWNILEVLLSFPFRAYLLNQLVSSFTFILDYKRTWNRSISKRTRSGDRYLRVSLRRWIRLIICFRNSNYFLNFNFILIR